MSFNPFAPANTKEGQSPFKKSSAKPKFKARRAHTPTKRPREDDYGMYSDAGSTYSGGLDFDGFDQQWCETMTKQILKLSQRERAISAAVFEGCLIPSKSEYVVAVNTAKDNWVSEKEKLGQDEMVEQNGPIHITKYLALVNQYRDDLQTQGETDDQDRVANYIKECRAMDNWEITADVKGFHIGGSKNPKVAKLEIAVQRGTVHYEMWKEIKKHLRLNESAKVHIQQPPRGGQERELEPYIRR